MPLILLLTYIEICSVGANYVAP